MRLVGVTGGPASGKSLAAHIMEASGAMRFSADEAAHSILNPESPIVHSIADKFGRDLLDQEGRIIRRLLAQQVFSDRASRLELNQIMHPPILRLLRSQIEACKDDIPTRQLLVIEVPLLFETRMESWFDQIVTVVSTEELQLTRLCERGMDRGTAILQIKSHWPSSLKAARSHHSLDNTGCIDQLEGRIHELLAKLLIL